MHHKIDIDYCEDRRESHVAALAPGWSRSAQLNTFLFSAGTLSNIPHHITDSPHGIPMPANDQDQIIQASTFSRREDPASGSLRCMRKKKKEIQRPWNTRSASNESIKDSLVCNGIIFEGYAGRSQNARREIGGKIGQVPEDEYIVSTSVPQYLSTSVPQYLSTYLGTSLSYARHTALVGTQVCSR